MRSSAKKPVIEKGRFWIFVWVAAVNALMILLGRTVAAVGYRSWSFFLCNILYFAMSEGEPRKKLVKLALGSAAGCAFAALTVLASGWLEPGMGEAAAIVPVVVTLALVILAEPLLPSVFNSAAFLYYTAALIVPQEAAANCGWNILWAELGVLVVIGGCQLVVRLCTPKEARG